MTDLNKEREVFEELPQFKYQLEVCEWNEEQGLYINESGDPDFEYFADACNGGLTAFLTQREEIARLKAELEKAKAQAVPVWISTDFMLPDEGEAVLFIDKNNVIHDGYLNTDYVDGPYGENGEDFGDDQTLWASNSNGDEFLLSEIKYWMHRPSSPSASESGDEG